MLIGILPGRGLLSEPHLSSHHASVNRRRKIETWPLAKGIVRVGEPFMAAAAQIKGGLRTCGLGHQKQPPLAQSPALGQQCNLLNIVEHLCARETTQVPFSQGEARDPALKPSLLKITGRNTTDFLNQSLRTPVWERSGRIPEG